MKQPVIYAGITGLVICSLSGCSFLSIAAEPSPLAPIDFSTLPPCVDDDCNCGDFRDQSAAQAVFEALPDDPFVLDQDANGFACETLPLSSPPVEADLTREPSAADSNNMMSGSNVHLGLGNPTNASTDDLNNFLLARSPYALSYNSDRGTANWVSWQLNADWLGDTERQDNFRQDGGLPHGVYQVTPNDYRNTGYDRGHIVPSGDRTRNLSDNTATFLMTNILPQVPENNRGIWRELEEYSRDLVYQLDWTLLIMAGGYGEQQRLASGKLTVPSRLWKIVVALEPGETLSDIDQDTVVIAVDLPNRKTVTDDWRVYQTTVDRIEVATGYDFLSALPTEIQTAIETTLIDTTALMSRE